LTTWSDGYKLETVEPASSGGTMMNWEYRRLVVEGNESDPQEELNALGSEGWELVSHTSLPGTSSEVFYLKRPQESQQSAAGSSGLDALPEKEVNSIHNTVMGDDDIVLGTPSAKPRGSR
jgi:hypothetical protein